MSDDERAWLESLVVDNRELEELETRLAEFNIFEALGAVRQELRHSDFLAFLLNPSQNHGLDDDFLKRFLKRTLAGLPDAPIGAIDIDVADLRAAVVQREWRNIDILVHDEANRLVVVLENKVGSGEHSDQLVRYRQIACHEFQDCRIVYIFLTPEGDQPSDEAYVPVNYADVAQLVEDVRNAHATTIGPDVGGLMAHYTAMLRRHIVTDSEVAELCQKIYQRHKGALDLIFEHRPDLQSDLADEIKTLIEGTDRPKLVLDHCSKTYLRFAPADWNNVPALNMGQGWTRSRRLLLFEFNNEVDQLSLKFIIGPGPDSVRQVIHDEVQKHRGIFLRRNLHTKWSTIYKKTFIARADYDDTDLGALVEKMRDQWHRFVAQDLPKITEFVGGITWPANPSA